MTNLDLARTAYGSGAAPIRTHRGSEHEALARVTARLRSASAGGANAFPQLAAALHDNRELWTVLAAGVADPENTLAPALRARLFYLAEFTDAHSAKVLRGRADPEVLVEINTAVMKGLRPTGAPE